MEQREFLGYLGKGALVIAASLAIAGCKERKRELSDIVYETATVHKKYISKKDDAFQKSLVYGNWALGMGEEQHWVRFKGQPASFRFNNKKLFEKFEEGEQAKVGYKEVYIAVYDKGILLLKRTLVDYKFVSAEKLAEY